MDWVLYLSFFKYFFSLEGGAELLGQEGSYTYSVLFSFYALKKKKMKMATTASSALGRPDVCS